MKVHVVVAALAIAGAQSGARAADAPAGRRVAHPDRLICREIPPVGSRLRGTRACGTAAEWSAYHAQIREGMRRIQGIGSTFCTPNTRVPLSRC